LPAIWPIRALRPMALLPHTRETNTRGTTSSFREATKMLPTTSNTELTSQAERLAAKPPASLASTLSRAPTAIPADMPMRIFVESFMAFPWLVILQKPALADVAPQLRHPLAQPVRRHVIRRQGRARHHVDAAKQLEASAEHPALVAEETAPQAPQGQGHHRHRGFRHDALDAGAELADL